MMMVYKLVNKPTKGKQKHEPPVPVWGYSRALAVALTAQKKIKSQMRVTTGRVGERERTREG